MIKVDTTITILAIPLMFLACQSQPASKAISQEQMVPAKEVQNAGCRSFDIKLSSASDPSKWNIGTQAEPLHPNLMTKFGRFSEISDYGNYQSLFMVCEVRNSVIQGVVIGKKVHNGDEDYLYLISECDTKEPSLIFPLAWIKTSPFGLSRIRSRLVNDSTMISEHFLWEYARNYADSTRIAYRITKPCKFIIMSADSFRIKPAVPR